MASAKVLIEATVKIMHSRAMFWMAIGLFMGIMFWPASKVFT